MYSIASARCPENQLPPDPGLSRMLREPILALGRFLLA
jgi:hypothetical protein